MARSDVTPTEIPFGGWVESLSAAPADGIAIQKQASGKATLIVNNGSGSSITITRKLGSTTDSQTSLTYTEPTYTVAAGAKRHIPVKFGSPFAQPSDDSAVWFDFSSVTTVTYAVVYQA